MLADAILLPSNDRFLTPLILTGSTFVSFKTNRSPGFKNLGRSLTSLSSILSPLAISNLAEDLGLAGLIAINSSGSSKSKSLNNINHSKLGAGRRKISLKIAGVKIESGLTKTSGLSAFPFNL